LTRLGALAKDREKVRLKKELDAPRGARDAPDKAFTFESEQHLVNGRRGHLEVFLEVGLGGGPTQDSGIGIDESEVLALLRGEVTRGHDVRMG
jgi:hypothetical protein